MDNIISWNMRGINGANKQKDVKAFCTRNKAGLICMMETKVKTRNFTKVARNLQDWEHYVNYESHERGRAWIMCKKTDFQVTIIDSMMQAIHCEIFHTFTNGRFDIAWKGCRYTWTNKQDCGQHIFSRIDRIMANGQWLAELPNSEVIFHPDDTSDHYP
ncbi:hypothetical protein Cgig2_017191 [Carnegiea gigantea]|uniref:Uncharacterized protein n=1 Tax=Carnegiea gigantea TaxID=171969 RepID=A0A9Q1JU66_9CARY|nr:hypothetical protein Cgig2_017191 [Carnegiea gigantea]